MRVRILQAIAAPTFSWTAGEVVEMSEGDAERWCDGVRAERLTEPPPKEPPKSRRAAKQPTEKAADRARGGGRGRGTETR